jgi:putative phosphoesterase
MKILVVSDTHVPSLAQTIPAKILEEARSCEMILHAGDLISIKVLDELSKLAPVNAVKGNMDLPEVARQLPSTRILSLEKWRIGLTHGHEGRGADATERARSGFSGKNADCVVFGHSHVPMSARVDGILLFNPGSPVAGRGRQGNTFGILHLGHKIEAEIVAT